MQVFLRQISEKAYQYAVGSSRELLNKLCGTNLLERVLTHFGMKTLLIGVSHSMKMMVCL